MTLPARSRSETFVRSLALSLLLLSIATPAWAMPQLAYTGGSGPKIRTADLDGTVHATIGGPKYRWFSIARNTVIGTVPTTNKSGNEIGQHVAGFNATTGAPRFRIRDARIALLGPEAAFVVFGPDNNGATKHDRDPRVDSLWYHEVGSGAEHRIARFPDDVGQPFNGSPIDLALNPAGTDVAIGHGNDGEFWFFDVWVAHTTGPGDPTRLTADGKSRYPAWSPSGTRIAYTWYDPAKPCAAQIRVMRADGTDKTVVAKSTCASRLYRPLWLSHGTLVAWRFGAHGRPTGLVLIDVATGATSTLVDARVYSVNVSRAIGELGYRLANGSIHLYDISSGTTRPVPGGTDLRGDAVALSGQLEQS